MPVDGRTLQQFCVLVRDTFTADELRQVVRFELDWDLDDIVPPGGMATLVFDLAGYAERRNRLPELARALCKHREYRSDLKLLADALTGNAHGGPVVCSICPYRPGDVPAVGNGPARPSAVPAGGGSRVDRPKAVAEMLPPGVRLPRPPKPPPPGPDPDDPQKGRWGGSAERDGRKLSARLRAQYAKSFEFDLVVTATDGTKLTGPVVFHVHDTFPKSAYHIRKMRADDTEALFELLEAYGTFTVGAQVRKARGGWTQLEYDLNDMPGIARRFRG
jgi:hypothetical protein